MYFQIATKGVCSHCVKQYLPSVSTIAQPHQYVFARTTKNLTNAVNLHGLYCEGLTSELRSTQQREDGGSDGDHRREKRLHSKSNNKHFLYCDCNWRLTFDLEVVPPPPALAENCMGGAPLNCAPMENSCLQH